jgi:hypothetical protein
MESQGAGVAQNETPLARTDGRGPDERSPTTGPAVGMLIISRGEWI